MKCNSNIHSFIFIIFVVSCELTFNLPERNNPNDSDADNFFGQKEIEMISPMSNATLTGFIPSFSWKEIDEAVTYEIQVDNDLNFSSPEININQIKTTKYIYKKQIVYGKHYLRIRAINKGNTKSIWTIIPFTFTSPMVNITSPDVNGTLNGFLPEFSWQALDNANSYDLQVDNNEDFLSPEINVKGIKETNYTHDSQIEFVITQYLRIRACINPELIGKWGTPIPFIQTSETVYIATPQKRTKIRTQTLEFIWQSLNQVKTYDLQVAKAKNFNTPFIDLVNLTNTRNIQELPTDNLFVRIRGTKENGHKTMWNVNNFEILPLEHNIQKKFNGACFVYAIDMDGDKDIDVLGAASNAHEITWWENDGSQHFTQHNICNDFMGVRSVHAADIDDDGDLDVLGAAYYNYGNIA